MVWITDFLERVFTGKDDMSENEVDEQMVGKKKSAIMAGISSPKLGNKLRIGEVNSM